MLTYDPRAWFWQTPAGIFSSAAAAIVPANNPAYEAFVAAGGIASRAGSLSDLYDRLAQDAPDIALTAAAAWLADGSLDAPRSAEARLAAGVRIQSTATPALDGTYPLDPTSQQRITAIAAGLAAGKGLPGGGTTIAWRDVAGAARNFVAADFLNFAAAVETYVFELLTGGMPAEPVTIA